MKVSLVLPICLSFAIISQAAPMNFDKRRFGQEHTPEADATFQEVKDLAQGSDKEAQAGNLSGAMVRALLAKAPACDQQDRADEVIDLGRQFGGEKEQQFIEVAKRYRQLERNTPNAGQPSELCDKPPKNKELEGLVQNQDPTGNPDDGDNGKNPDDGDNGKNPDDGDNGKNPDDGDNGKNPDDGDNGKNPDDGDNGKNPDDGDNGKNPDDGDNGKNPDDGDDGKNPDDGDDGKNPDDGDDGKNPDDGDDGKNPDDGDDGKNPDDGDNGKNPDDGDDGKNPDDGDDGKMPEDGDNGKNPDDGDDGDNGKNPDSDSENIAETDPVGGVKMPKIKQEDGDFIVNGNGFNGNLDAAHARQCDVQKNLCFNKFNGGDKSFSGADCEQQVQDCKNGPPVFE